MRKKLITEETLGAYMDRLQSITTHKFSEKGDELFITTLVAEAEQINNLYIKAKVGDFEIKCDEPKALACSNLAPTPMELLLASFANCLEVSALLYFTFGQVPVNSVKVRVEATFDKRAILPDKEAPLPGFYNFHYTWFIDSKAPLRKIEQVLDKVDRNCPVKGTFSKDHNYKRKIVFINRD